MMTRLFIIGFLAAVVIIFLLVSLAGTVTTAAAGSDTLRYVCIAAAYKINAVIDAATVAGGDAGTGLHQIQLYIVDFLLDRAPWSAGNSWSGHIFWVDRPLPGWGSLSLGAISGLRQLLPF